MSQKQSGQSKNNIANVIEQKRILKQKIKDLKNSIGRISNGSKEGIEANQAQTRLDSFIYLHGHINANSSPNLVSRYNAAKDDLENKRKISKRVNAIYREKMAELKELNDELNALRLPISDDDFSIEGFSEYIEKAVLPFRQAIELAKQKLEQLQKKRERLKVQLLLIDTRAKPLDDENLVNIEVDDHFAQQSKIKDQQAKKESIEDLISQLDKAIGAQQKLLEKTRIDFADNYTIAANNYSQLGIKATAKALQKILQSQKAYLSEVEQVSRRIINETGVSQQHIFDKGGISPAIMKNLFGSRPRVASEIQFLVDAALG